MSKRQSFFPVRVVKFQPIEIDNSGKDIMSKCPFGIY